MVRTLELQRLDEYASLQKVASFATLVATYEKGERSAELKFVCINVIVQVSSLY
jgi:hypothetical protein